ncbi:MAG: putative transposase [Verrucomicrobiales bacterium]|jgi:putative transposase
MRRTRKFLLNIKQDREMPDGAWFVHGVSPTAGQEILFGDHEKETFRKILFKQLKFSGLRALAWCFMGNQFHLLLEVPDKEVALAALSDEDVLSRLAVFGGEKSTKFALAELETCRSIGNVAGVERIAEKVRAGLFDLSLFMKELKRQNGGRRLKSAQWGGLRDLKTVPVVTSSGCPLSKASA